ncbi:MAG: prepilin peptidase, partial [Candidatus Micrarchaeota archaeon]
VAAYYDVFNNRNVPNWLTYSLVAIGIVFSIYVFVSEDITSESAPKLFSMGFFTSLLTTFGPALSLLVVGYYFYVNGQIGGADVLVFVAIALLVPQQPFSLTKTEGTPLIKIPYVVSIFALSGVLFSTYMFCSMFPKVMGAILAKKVKLEPQKALTAFVVLALYGFLLWNMMRIVPIVYILITGIVLVSAFFVYLFRDFILDEYVIQSVPLDKIDEEDVLAIEKMDQELVKKYGLKKVLTTKEFEKLKSVPLKVFPIYKNMNSYMPHVLAAMLITVVTGDVFAFLLRIR